MTGQTFDAGTFDYIVVGAGSAGCVVASRLSEDPGVRVALIEAGDPDDDPEIRVPFASPGFFGSALDWAFDTTAQPGLAGREIYWPRGRTLGGSSSINFQMWVPGGAVDFEAWVAAAGGLWAWSAVEPYFRRAERWAGAREDGHTHGQHGPLWISMPRDPDPSTEVFLDACVETGLKPIAGGLGGPDTSGCAISPVNQLDGARWSAADGYLRPALRRENLTVVTGQLVRRVVLDADRRAVGVELGYGLLRALREVVLCAGTVGSPQVLMRSGVGEPESLGRAGIRPRVELPGVGRNLRDHLILDLAVRARGPLRFTGVNGRASRRRYEQERLGPLTSNIGEAVAFLRADGQVGAPDLEFIWSPVAFGADGGVLDGYTLGVVLLQPESHGRIDLTGADPAAAPAIDPGYLTAEADLRTYLTGVRLAERLLATEALRPLVGDPLGPWAFGLSDEACEALVRENAQTVFHPVGTCRMGRPDDPDAVVDPWLRVRGVTGLRVVDASVIPRLPRGHTHAHAVMIGERGADLIRERTSPAGH
ncbi:GMC family oxidoreductase N-terminal domain-containing protein [Micromonospora sp. NPDC049523]|uniref:GMC family oxidoreductase n=1 Tax=Micromonospora sp. NPDC049523 TaxID=3155921 RepID=UPI003427F2B5